MIELPAERQPATPFPEGLAWHNTDRPLTFANELKGRVVVLDFWTYCCINCMHILPHIERLEREFADQPVVVVGVHSAKFDNEAEARNVRTAILRYGIKHPVVVDDEMTVWGAYGVRAWPTLVFIDAQGGVIGAVPGEMDYKTMSGIVAQLLADGKAKGVLADGPPALQPEESVPAASGQAFPGKVLAAAEQDSIFVADSNHHRIIEATLSGQVRAVYGSGQEGLADGPATSARFNNPQGMAFDAAARLLFVADTDNHALREINLATKQVRTLAGDGAQHNDRAGGKKGAAQGLNSPWALALDGKRIIIAMAGLHQLWAYDRSTGVAGRWVGSGLENVMDGSADRAALAQPSGLAISEGRLYVADSEVSAIRQVALDSGETSTLIGRGLFVFGDRDGPLAQSLLQHPLGIAAGAGGALYVADSYNHKIKRLDLAKREIATILGSGQTTGEERDGAVHLYEPGGISVSDGTLYIADTNHHRILALDLKTNETRELILTGLPEVPAAK
ncbi:thioredoxin-like domain-containing protein [Candidatus Sumerlaeota bacterium]